MHSGLDDSVYKKYKLAGRIASNARDFGVKLIKEGANILKTANNVESRIINDGGGLAFPVNISVNEVAAHFSPRHDDTKLVFKKGDVVKLDVGAHIDGYIADTAITVEVGTNNYEDMIKASQDALNAAVDYIKADASLSILGKTIEKTIKSYGYRSIDNLTGHSLARYNLHSGLSIPNVHERLNLVKLNPGEVLAVEPFATNGAGHVISGNSSNIYRYIKSVKSRIIRDTKIRLFSSKINKKFSTLPFAERWCTNLLPNTDISLKKLLFAGCIKQYPQLIDEKKGIVTQAEHTVIVREDGCEVTT
jgi:methionyl aminopeptidase